MSRDTETISVNQLSITLLYKMKKFFLQIDPNVTNIQAESGVKVEFTLGSDCSRSEPTPDFTDELNVKGLTELQDAGGERERGRSVCSYCFKCKTL